MYDNVAELWHALGDVPLERIVMNPLPGTATEQDLLTLVERDKRLVELIDGTLVEKPVGSLESAIAGWLITYLNVFIGPRKLGVVFGEAAMMRIVSSRVRLPDVSFFSRERLATWGGKPILNVAPDLAVEVISEGNTKAEMRQKMKEYFDSGTRLVWLVYPKTRTIEVYEQLTEQPARTLGHTDTLDGGSVLPGFAVPVADVFQVQPLPTIRK
jgi:Uma2 family endonuclease